MIFLALIVVFVFFSMQKKAQAIGEIETTREKELPYVPEVTLKAQRNIFDRHKAAISDASHKYNVPAWVIVGLINTESGGNSKTRGSKGEVGLMQLYPDGAIADWRKKFGVIYSDSFFEEDANNIQVGAWHLSQGHAKTGANWLNTAIHVYQVGAVGYMRGRRSPDRDARLKRFTEAILITDANEYTV